MDDQPHQPNPRGPDLNAAQYYRTFTHHATQLNGATDAKRWHQAGIGPIEAATWANAGHVHQTAKPLIARGVTAAEALADSEARLADWIS